MPKKQKRPKFKKVIQMVKVDFKPSDIDYKNPAVLSKFLTARFKIMPKSRTNVSAKIQRKLSDEIKKARIMGLLPFTEKQGI